MEKENRNHYGRGSVGRSIKNKIKREERISEGLCYKCGKVNKTKEFSMCADCRHKHKIYQRKLKKKVKGVKS